MGAWRWRPAHHSDFWCMQKSESSKPRFILRHSFLKAAKSRTLGHFCIARWRDQGEGSLLSLTACSQEREERGRRTRRSGAGGAACGLPVRCLSAACPAARDRKIRLRRLRRTRRLEDSHAGTGSCCAPLMAPLSRHRRRAFPGTCQESGVTRVMNSEAGKTPTSPLWEDQTMFRNHGLAT